MGALETDEEGREAAPGKVTRTRPDGAVGTVGVDAGAPAAGVPAEAPASLSANGGGVPAGAGSDVHAAGPDGA
jgi:hypothetical protein